jgi:hypothetical protein
MAVSRRQFLADVCKTVFIIGMGNTLQSFSGKDYFGGTDAKDIKLRFAVVSDGHYGQPDTDYRGMHEEMRRWLNQEHQARGLDFIFINGDLFHNDPVFLPEVKKLWDGLTRPYYVSRGNHDQTDAVTWGKTWKIPFNYSFDKKDTGFIVLDTANEKGEYVCPDITWAQKQLQAFHSKQQVFVFMHITPFDWTKGGHPCPQLVDLFNTQSNLKATFHGHDHDQDNVKNNAGKFYFFDGHTAGNWGTSYRGYRIVEIMKNGSVVTYQINPANGTTVNNNTW